MNERPQAKIVELIQKILSKTTESGCTEAEASEAFAKAQAMLLKHNLSMDDVRCKDNKDGEEQFSDEAAFQTGRWTYEQNLAYAVIKNHCFVEGYFGKRAAGNDKVLYLFGTQANVATAHYMFTALLAATERMWIVYRYTRKRPASEARMFRTGMIKGFSDKLDLEREALKMEQDILKGSTGGTALAIIRIDQLTVAKYKEAHPENTRKGRANFADLAGDASTLQAGYDAGKRLNLNRAIGGNGGRKGIG